MLRPAFLTIALSAVALGAYLWHGIRDASPLADGDLVSPRAAVPAAANGYQILEEALDGFSWSTHDEERLTTMRLHGVFDEAFVQEIVLRGESALSRLPAALRAPEFVSPPMDHLDSDVPDFARWVRLAQVCAFRAALRARAGDLDGAVEGGLALLQLANRILADPSAALVHAMVATRVKASGAWAFQAALPFLEPTPEQSRVIALRIGAERIDPEAWRAMWAEEYELAKRSLRAATGQASSGDSLAFRFLPASYLFHANATIALYGDLIRELRSHAGAPCSAIRPPATEASAFVAKLDAVLRPNAEGRAFVTSASGPLRYAELRRCRSDAEIAALEALVALRAYQVRHGALPGTLDALVPEYLDAVPVDPYVAAPLGYDPERRLVLSAGSDLDVEPFGGFEDPAFVREPSWSIPF
jgi:hypothetical protein